MARGERKRNNASMEQRNPVTVANEPLADARDMFAIHTVFRREFGLMPDLVRNVADGDLSRAMLVADHIARVSLLLHVHHTEEDKHVWPPLLKRGNAEITSLVYAMEDEHEEIFEYLEQVEEGRKSWIQTAYAEARDAVADAVERLLPVLKRHLAEEEEHIVPLIEQYITAAEWARIPQEAAANIPPDEFPTIFGMIAYEGDPDVVDMIVAEMPPEMRPFIKEIGSKAYAMYAQTLYGTSTPARVTKAA